MHLQGLNKLTAEQLYKKYCRPCPEPVVRIDGRPLEGGMLTHAIMPIRPREASERISLSNARILITDFMFGESFMPSITKQYRYNAPVLLRPAELPKELMSFPADIWTFACTILASARYLKFSILMMTG